MLSNILMSVDALLLGTEPISASLANLGKGHGRLLFSTLKSNRPCPCHYLKHSRQRAQERMAQQYTILKVEMLTKNIKKPRLPLDELTIFQYRLMCVPHGGVQHVST